MTTGTVERIFLPGQKLFKEGDVPKCLYLIKSGKVVIQVNKKGKTIDLAELKANQVVGELSFFDRKKRSASALAVDEVAAIEISFEALEKLYAAVPNYMKAIISTMGDRLREANERIQILENRLEKSSITEE